MWFNTYNYVSLRQEHIIHELVYNTHTTIVECLGQFASQKGKFYYR